MSSRPGVSIAQLVEAGLRIAREEGLAALSIRRLASELSVSHTAMYWYVDSKDDLLELIWDAALADVTLPPAEAAAWDERLVALARQTWRVYRRYPDLAAWALVRQPPVLTAQVLRLAESTLQLLAEGVGPDEAFRSFVVCQQFMVGYAQVAGEERYRAALGLSLERLEGAPDHPLLTRHVGDGGGSGMSEEALFEHGFRCLITGLVDVNLPVVENRP
jgi:AcrR family transcriptional regulator